MAKTRTARLTIPADGTSHSEEVVKMPKHWVSYVMHRMPYGTDFLGAKGSNPMLALQNTRP